METKRLKRYKVPKYTTHNVRGNAKGEWDLKNINMKFLGECCRGFDENYFLKHFPVYIHKIFNSTIKQHNSATVHFQDPTNPLYVEDDGLRAISILVELLKQYCEGSSLSTEDPDDYYDLLEDGIHDQDLKFLHIVKDEKRSKLHDILFTRLHLTNLYLGPHIVYCPSAARCPKFYIILPHGVLLGCEGSWQGYEVFDILFKLSSISYLPVGDKEFNFHNFMGFYFFKSIGHFPDKKAELLILSLSNAHYNVLQDIV